MSTKKRPNLYTEIRLTARKLLVGQAREMVVGPNGEPGWVRTYSRLGWQRFPVDWIMQNSIPIDPKEVYWIEQELKAKGYIAIIEKETM